MRCYVEWVLKIIIVSGVFYTPLYANVSPEKTEEEYLIASLNAFQRLRGIHPDFKDLKRDRPTCFVSYAWGVPEQVEKVHTLAKYLRLAGINVLLDMTHNTVGTDVPPYALKVLDADYVILVGSKKLMEKYEGTEPSVVRAELNWMMQRFYRKEHNIVPVRLDGNHPEVFPLAFRGIASQSLDKNEIYFDILKQLYKLKQEDPYLQEIRDSFQKKQIADLEKISEDLKLLSEPPTLSNREEDLTSKDPLNVNKLREKAKGNDPEAQYELGLSYKEGKRVLRKPLEALEWFEKSAAQGHTKAQLALVHMYLNLDYNEVPVNDDKALKWVRELIRQENTECQRILGWMYFNNRGELNKDDKEKNYKEAAKWYKKAAEKGDVEAQRNFALMCQRGQGVEKDEIEATRWFNVAADNGDIMAKHNLGWMYQEGRGVAHDDEKAVKLYQEAAALGNVRAKTNLGWMYQKGRGVARDDEKAVKLYQEAAVLGDVRAKSYLGWMYQEGRGVARDDEKAVKLYEEATSLGSVEAKYNLGLMYRNGRGVPQDDKKAAELYAEAASLGEVRAKCSLGVMHINGRGVPHDEEKAFKLFEEAASLGSVAAKHNLGWMYDNGRGVSRDSEKAVKLYEEAVALGYADSKYNLGWMYQEGRGVARDGEKAAKLFEEAAALGSDTIKVYLGNNYRDGWGLPRDDEKAAKLYEEAAALGSVAAKYNLGWMYANGRGVPRDDEKAAKLYEEAAVLGDADAQYEIGIMYLKGRGVKKDKKVALEWLHKAAEQGHMRAKLRIWVSGVWFSGMAVAVVKHHTLFNDTEMNKWPHLAAQQWITKVQSRFPYGYYRSAFKGSRHLQVQFKNSLLRKYSQCQQGMHHMWQNVSDSIASSYRNFNAAGYMVRGQQAHSISFAQAQLPRIPSQLQNPIFRMYAQHPHSIPRAWQNASPAIMTMYNNYIADRYNVGRQYSVSWKQQPNLTSLWQQAREPIFANCKHSTSQLLSRVGLSSALFALPVYVSQNSEKFSFLKREMASTSWSANGMDGLLVD